MIFKYYDGFNIKLLKTRLRLSSIITEKNFTKITYISYYINNVYEQRTTVKCMEHRLLKHLKQDYYENF